MRKADKDRSGKKQHFELSPSNRRRMDEFLAAFNENPDRVTPRLKIGDIVNMALDEWLGGRSVSVAVKGPNDGKEAR